MAVPPKMMIRLGAGEDGGVGIVDFAESGSGRGVFAGNVDGVGKEEEGCSWARSCERRAWVRFCGATEVDAIWDCCTLDPFMSELWRLAYHPNGLICLIPISALHLLLYWNYDSKPTPVKLLLIID